MCCRPHRPGVESRWSGDNFQRSRPKGNTPRLAQTPVSAEMLLVSVSKREHWESTNQRSGRDSRIRIRCNGWARPLSLLNRGLQVSSRDVNNHFDISKGPKPVSYTTPGVPMPIPKVSVLAAKLGRMDPTPGLNEIEGPVKAPQDREYTLQKNSAGSAAVRLRIGSPVAVHVKPTSQAKKERSPKVPPA